MKADAMNLPGLSALFSTDLAIDLGTANTLVFAKDRGIVIDEPSVIAVNTKTGQIEAVGSAAKEMIGRTHAGIDAISPMRNGVIADFTMAERMLTWFVRKAHNRRLPVSPRVVISVPSGITPVERRAVLDSAHRAKAREVHLVDQAMMAALGVGLPVTEPAGSMIVDIGGGTTDVAIVSLGGVVYSRSLRVAGNAMDAAIAEYIRRKYHLLIGDRTAERVKIGIGSAHKVEKPLHAEIRGRDLLQGVPRTITVGDDEIREAMAPAVAAIVGAVRLAIEYAPPEFSGDILEQGLVLTGGGAMLRGLDVRIRQETGLPVLIAAEPLTSVVAGTGQVLGNLKLLRRMSMN
jgi:rod shape-determining protein MreB and related proteins